MPKARSARDVWWVDVLLTQLETKLGLTRPIGLEVLIEEAEGLANAAEIARSSARLEAIIFGAGDLSASLRRPGGRELRPGRRVPRRLLALRPGPGAGRGPRRRASTPSTPRTRPTRTPTGYRRSAVHASLLGFDGKWAIHPDQIAIANEVFAPTAEEIAEAQRVHRGLPRRRRPSGVGAIGRDGKLVDAAHMRLAANVLHKAALGRRQ